MRTFPALLVVLLAGCARLNPVISAEKRELPPIPPAAYSILGPIPVVWADTITKTEEGYIVLGRFYPLNRTILLWRGIQSREEQWRVFVHESCHAWHWDYGIRAFDEQAERFCDAVAYAHVASMMERK